MIRGYLRVGFRNILKDKLHSIINVIGMSIAIVFSMLILIYIFHETSYDKFHKNHKNIYRITLKVKWPGDTKFWKTPTIGAEFKDQIEGNIDGIQSICRLYSYEDHIKVKEKKYYPDHTIFADKEFFNVFNFPIITGNKNSLAIKNSVVIDQTTALKLFNTTEVIGKEIKFKQKYYTVNAVIKDIPNNSHFTPNCIFSFCTESDYIATSGLDTYTYFTKENKASSKKIEQDIQLQVKDFLGKWFKDNYKHEAAIQNITDIRLGGDFKRDIQSQNKKSNLYIIGLLVLFILLIAIINFVNLLTAKSEYRLKEVGVRKVNGANRADIIKQFLSESLILSFISFFIALFLLEIFIKDFGNIFGYNFLNFYHSSKYIISVFFLLTMFIGLFSGSYPAFYITRYNPVNIITGNFKLGKNTLSKVLVVFQFSIAIFLIACIFILYSQVEFMKKKELGFNKEHLVSFYYPSNIVKKDYKFIKNELSNYPGILSIGFSQSIPGYGRSGQGLTYKDKRISISENRVQKGYIKTFGFDIIAGTDFVDFKKDKYPPIILNEAAVKALDIKNPIGKLVQFFNKDMQIAGVLKDYNYSSLKNSINPLMLSNYVNWYYRVSFRIKAENKKATINYISHKLKEHHPNWTARPKFIKDVFKNLYKKEEKHNLFIMIGAGLAIFIAMLGLFILISYTSLKRTKEICVKKILGANNHTIIYSYLKNTLIQIVIASLISLPIFYLVMSNWLDNFAYKINLNIIYYLLAVIVVSIVSFATIYYQAYKSAQTNAAQALRTE